MHGRAARDFASSSGCKQMVTEPTRLDGGVLDLVLTDVLDVVGVRADSPVGTFDRSAVLIDVWLEQPKLTWFLGRRSISKILWTRSWLEGI